MLWYTLYIAFLYSFIQLVHVNSRKRRSQRKHLINNTSKWPNIRLKRILLISPHLRRCIVRSARLRWIHPLSSHFRHIHIPQLRLIQQWPRLRHILTYIRRICLSIRLLKSSTSFFAVSSIRWWSTQKNIRWFNIPMHYVEVVHLAQSMHCFD